MWKKAAFALVTILSYDVQLARAGDPFPDKPYPNVVRPAVQFGSYGSKLGQFNDPSAVAISDRNEIFIAECFNHRIQVFDASGNSIRSWLILDGDQQRCPQGIAISQAGEVYVAEREGRIAVFDEMGNFKRAFGRPGAGRGKLSSPTNLATSDDAVFVTDTGNNRILKFDPSGKLLLTIGNEGSDNGSFTGPTSVSVDADSNIYVTDALNRIQKFGSDGSFKTSWGNYGGLPGQLAAPSDISVINGHVYVADTVNHRLQAFDGYGKLVLVWGRHPEIAHEGMGHTHYPSSIKISPDGSMAVVCEPFEYRCQLFQMSSVTSMAEANTSAWWEKFPRFHYGGGAKVGTMAVMQGAKANLLALQQKLALPTDQAALPQVPRQMLVITEPDLHRVVAFSLDTSIRTLSEQAQAQNNSSVDLPIMYSIGSFGHNPGQFVTLAGKRPMLDGTLLVTDAGANNIQQFHLLTGQHLKTLFGPGAGPGQFHGPSGIEESPEGLIYIGDFHNDRIQVFDKNYNFQFSFGKTGDGPGDFFGPLSLTFDRSYKRLYVTDTGNQRVQVFDPKGNFLFQFGHLTRPGQPMTGTFQWPFDVAVSAKGFVYVSDPELQTVQKFSAEGAFVSQWGGWGTGPGQFYKPKGLDIDDDGNVYVVDFGNHRGQIFDEDGRFEGIFGEGVLYPASSQPGPPPSK